MKNLFFILILVVINNSCTSSNPLDKWVAGTSNRNIGELQNMADNGLIYMEAGWPGVNRQSPEETEIWAKEMKTAADKAGVTVWSVHLPYGGIYDISESDEETRQNAVAQNAAAMELSSRTLAPKCFIIHPSAEPVAEEVRAARFAASRKSLQELAVKAKACNAELLAEVLPRTCIGNTSVELMRLIDGIDNVAICFDVNHLLHETHSAFIQNTKGKIKSTHMSDYDRIDERHWLPGKGVIDWTAMLKELVATGYNGPFIYEVSRGNPPEISMKDLAECWQKLKAEASK